MHRKRLLFVIICITPFVLSISIFSNNKPFVRKNNTFVRKNEPFIKKHALLIGIGEYEKNAQWPDLAALNDINLIESTILGQGFEQQNIHRLINNSATKKMIISALRKKILNKINPGDIVYFHFSGHGQQIQDFSGDEIDGLDECLVTYKAHKHFNYDAYQGAEHLTDDELNKILDTIRRKLGQNGHLLLTIDACYSGSITRGLIKVRGTNIIMADTTFIEAHGKQANQIDKYYLSSSNNKNSALAPMVVITGASPYEVAQEYKMEQKEHGLFSYSFCQALSNLPPNATYKSLQDVVDMKMKQKTFSQNVHFEGPLSHTIFNTGLQKVEPYFKASKRIGLDALIVAKGTLHGLSNGTKVQLMSVDTKTGNKKMLTDGVVLNATPFDCDIQLNKQISKKQALDAHIYITEQSFPYPSVTLANKINNNTISNQLNDFLTSNSNIQITDKAADLYLEQPAGLTSSSRIFLFQNDERILLDTTISDSNLLGKTILKTVQNYSKAKYLRQLETIKKSLIPSVEMLIQQPDGKYVVCENHRLKIGQTAKIKISNIGPSGFYFSILDIMPDDEIYQAIPSIENNEKAIDFYLHPGKVFVSGEFEVSEPVGIDFLKIIATQQPIDISSQALRSQQSAMNQLIAPLLESENFEKEKKSKSTILPIDAGYIGSYIFEIIQ